MSLILDALKRAERERSGERSAALQDLPGVPRQETGRWGRRLALVAVASIAGVVAWHTLRPTPTKAPAVPPRVATEAPREDAPTEAAANEQAPAQRPAPAQQQPPASAQPTQQQQQPKVFVPMKPASPPAIQARPAPAPVIPGTESVASLDDVQSDEEIAAQSPAPAPAPAAEPEVARPLPEPAQPPAQPAAGGATPAEPEVDAAETQDAPEPARPGATKPDAIPDHIPKALTQQAPMRKLREMPPEYRADFPALNVEVHVYERAPAQRFVLVNGRRYRQGERMAEGPQLIEIVQEGLVLEYRGERILYPLGR